MFLIKPKGPKDSMQSLFQAYGEQNHIVNNLNDHGKDTNVATTEIESKAENKSYCSFSGGEVNTDGPWSEELGKVKEAELRELKLREQICRDSPELTELNNKLHQACVRKDIALQMQEQENKKQEDKILNQMYRDQLHSATQRQILEADEQEKLAALRKVEYRKALEEQMAAEAEQKREEKYRHYLEEQKLTQDEIDRMIEEDKKSQMEQSNKLQKIRQDMQESLKTREEIRQEEKTKNLELEKNVVSYWEESTKHERELKQERQERQKLITQRQEQCAQSLQEINQRKQTRLDLMDNITVVSQLATQDSGDLQSDLEQVDRKLKQSQLCSQLDGQVADKVRNRQSAQRACNDFQETWIWGDAAQQKGKEEESWRRQREVADYNRATVKGLEEQRRRERRNGGDLEIDIQDEFKVKLIEEEKQRLLKAQHAIEQ